MLSSFQMKCPGGRQSLQNTPVAARGWEKGNGVTADGPLAISLVKIGKRKCTPVALLCHAYDTESTERGVFRVRIQLRPLPGNQHFHHSLLLPPSPAPDQGLLQPEICQHLAHSNTRSNLWGLLWFVSRWPPKPSVIIDVAKSAFVTGLLFNTGTVV